MNLYRWAIKHQIPMTALNELKQALGMIDTDPKTTIPGESEAAVQNKVRLEASRKGARLWRNNVGAGLLDDGSFIRWGLVNDSQQMNSKIKSSDLIGIKPVLIAPIHVGTTLGVFVAREVKEGGWTYAGTDREVGQLNFLNLVASLGGDAAFCNSEGSL